MRRPSTHRRQIGLNTAGVYYYVRCMTAYKDADICPNCGTKTRKKGRKNSNGEKPRIDIEFDENDVK